MTLLSTRNGSYMRTYSGAKFYPLDPRAEDMRIIDVAHHLAMQPRFCGAVKRHYSVAEHCVIGSYHVPRSCALEFLLHDAPETWMGDMIRPIKHASRAGDEFRIIEAPIDRVMRSKWSLPAVESPEIEKIDDLMCELEMQQVYLHGPYHPLPAGFPLAMRDTQLHFWTWSQAERAFLARFEELTRKEKPDGDPAWWRRLFNSKVVTA